MISKKCIDAEKLICYKNSDLSGNELNDIRKHLSNCELCRNNLQILDRIDKIISQEVMAINEGDHKPEKGKACLSEHQLYNYIDGHVTKSEARKFGEHLNSCKYCLSELASLARNSLTPMTNKEKATVEELWTLSIEEQADKILAYQEEEKRHASDKSEEMAVSWDRKVVEVIKKLFNQFFIAESLAKPVFVSLILVMCVFGVHKGIQYYNTGYQIKLAEALLKENYKTFKESARLSGGYAPTGISFLLSTNEDTLSYFEQAELKLKRAELKGSQSDRIKHLLAQIYIMETEISRADSILALIKDTTLNAVLHNDKGKIFFDQEDYRNALIKFQSAIELDPNFLEAQFNLALTKRNLGETEEANSILKKYIELEDNDEWKTIAQGLIDDMNCVEEEMK
jgi:tetratricopeptide (TPR) repeat protein